MSRVRRPARRFATAVAVAVLGLTMAGCRSDPSVAAYVGDTTFTEARVVRIVDEFVDTLTPEQRANADISNLRNQVVQLLVLGEVINDYAEREDIEVARADPAGTAQRERLPRDLELTTVLARYRVAMDAMRGEAEPVSPTEPEQREAYRNATLNNQPVAEPFDEVQQYFNRETLGSSVGLRRLLVEAVAAADVSVNPRYDRTYRVVLQIQQVQSWLSVDLDGAIPVRDAPVPVPTRATDGQGGAPGSAGHNHG